MSENHWGKLVSLLDCSGIAQDVEDGHGAYDDVDAVMVSRVEELLAERDQLREENERLKNAARRVCWYDYSTTELDGDAILDMRNLKTLIESLDEKKGAVSDGK